MAYITIYKSFVQHKQRDNLFGFVLIRVKRLASVLIDMKELLQITLKLELLKYFVHDDMPLKNIYRILYPEAILL